MLAEGSVTEIRDKIPEHPTTVALTSDDVRRIDAAGKKVAMIGVENGYPIGLDISRIIDSMPLNG